MANIRKYKSSGAYSLIAHDNRERVSTSFRENIDPRLSHLNYELRPKSVEAGNEFLRYKTVLNSADRILKRSDLNTLCSIVITKPKTLDDKYAAEFFDAAFRHLCINLQLDINRFVSCYVHYDEPNSQPHMHFKFVPIYENEKTGKTSVNFSKLINREFYRSFHTDLKKFIEDRMQLKFGKHIEVDILNGETKGVKDVNALKELTAREKALKKEKKEVKEENEKLEFYNQTLKSKEQNIINLEIELEEYRKKMEKQFDEAYVQIDKEYGKLEEREKEIERVERLSRRNKIKKTNIDQRNTLKAVKKALKRFGVEDKLKIDEALKVIDNFEKQYERGFER